MRFYKKGNSVNENGLTLLEIVIVVVIIGVLAAIAVLIGSSQQKEAIRAQVESDVLSTSGSLSTWQNGQVQHMATPSASDFATKVRVTSNSATTVSLKVGDWGDPATKQFCIEGSSDISGERYVVNYSTLTQVLIEGACAPFVEEEAEDYQ